MDPEQKPAYGKILHNTYMVNCAVITTSIRVNRCVCIYIYTFLYIHVVMKNDIYENIDRYRIINDLL